MEEKKFKYKLKLSLGLVTSSFSKVKMVTTSTLLIRVSLIVLKSLRREKMRNILKLTSQEKASVNLHYYTMLQELLPSRPKYNLK
jgi:hypothetical protein